MTYRTIIGVGCAGGRMVNAVVDVGRIQGEFVAINTDCGELKACKADTKILIGERSAIRLGGKPPHLVMEAAADAVEGMARLCAGRDAVTIVAALGGGAGTGIAPIVARIAKKQGCQVAAVVTKPFEDRESLANALVGIRTLKDVDLLLIVPLMDLLPILRRSVSLGEVFRAGDIVVAKTVELLPRLLTKPGMEGHKIVDVAAVSAFAQGAGKVTEEQDSVATGGGFAAAPRTNRLAQRSGRRGKQRTSRATPFPP